MSGPALRKRDSHYAIHESAYGEAEELTYLLKRFLDEDQLDKAYSLIPVIVEHWQTRTLPHADEEEEGLYKELIIEHPDWGNQIAALKRDHDLLRKLTAEVEIDFTNLDHAIQTAPNEAALLQVWSKCQTLLWLNQVHSRFEETLLTQ